MADESMDEEMMDEEPMADESSMDEEMEEMPKTGHESGVLVIVGASILVAGLLVLGTGRRVRTVIR